MLNTLRGKFLLFILLPILTGLVALTSISYYSARYYLLKEMRKSGSDALKVDAESLRAFIVRERAVLDTIAIAQQFDNFTDAERRKMFVEVRDTFGDYVTSVFMGFPDGRMIRSKAIPLPEGFDPRTRPWYIDAVALPPGELHGGTGPYKDASTSRPVITAFRKVNDVNGSFIGVMGLDIDIELIAESLTTYTDLPKNGIRFIVSNTARILVHPEPALVDTFLDRSGEAMDTQIAAYIKDPNVDFHQFFGLRGDNKWYMGFQSIAGTRSSIVLMLPAKEVLRPLNNLVRDMSIIATALIFVLLIVIHVMNRKITRPVYALTDAAEKLVEEDRYHDALEVESRDELGRLTKAFNFMMDGLKQRDFIRDTFGRYVTKEVVEELIDNPEGLRLGGEKREVTIMFSDIRGFTPLSEHLGPEQVVDLLNRYLGEMAAIVEKYGGTVSEFVGDSILAFFGAPVDHSDSPSRAVACAVEMQMAMEAINRDNVQSGLPEVAMGIGVNTGEVVVGNIGSEKRAKYGVVGHAINLTARVESSTIGGQILISSATYEKVKDTVIIKQEQKIRLKGVEEEVVLYDVAGVTLPERMMVPVMGENAAPLSPPWDVLIIRTKDKKETEFVAKGRLIHYSKQWAHVAVEEKIPPPTEIRIDICAEEECADENIYGRVAGVNSSETATEHVVRVSYTSPEAHKKLSGSTPS